MTEVLAFDRYTDNSGLIAAAAQLGYLQRDKLTLDATWGHGTFWKEWAPDRLVGLDRVPHKARDVRGDFTALPFADRTFWAVVFDGPYKLNGTPDEEVDARYGVDVPETWQDRMALLRRGARACARAADRFLLVKCQDQVASGAVRWQTLDLIRTVEQWDFRLVDQMFLEGGRPQPEGFWKCPHEEHRSKAQAVCLEGVWVARTQKHARRNYSTLLVFERVPPPR